MKKTILSPTERRITIGYNTTTRNERKLFVFTVSDLPIEDDMYGSAHPCFISAGSTKSHQFLDADG
jgi:hypothetical protein